MRLVLSSLNQPKSGLAQTKSRLNQRKSATRGFVLIAMCACMFILLAAMGLAFDLGRIYIVRNEAQFFVDAGAMAAAAQMDGTVLGLERARVAVERLPGHWNMAAEPFRDVVVEFSADGQHWVRTGDASRPIQEVDALHLARVTAPENHLEITFLRAVGGPQQFTVPAYAIAAGKSAVGEPVRLVE